MSERNTAGRDKQRTRLTARQRRESILAAATEVFCEVGYLRGKTSAVARRVGVSEPVVFQNFGTKASLFAEVVADAAERMCGDLERAAAETDSVSGLLADLLAPEHVRRVHAPGSVGALFADAASISGEPEIETAAREATQRFANVLAGILERGRSTGEVRAELDPHTAAWWLLSLLASQRFRQATAEDPTTIETALAESTLLFLTGGGG